MTAVGAADVFHRKLGKEPPIPTEEFAEIKRQIRDCVPLARRQWVDSRVPIDGKAIKIASMIDEHTRCSLLNIVERSITAERLVTELEAVFTTAGGPPKVLRMDNGPELVSKALQRFCAIRPAWSTSRRIARGRTAISNHSTTA
jgi:transposase InsO family protein